MSFKSASVFVMVWTSCFQVLLPIAANAKVLIGLDEALKLAFAGCQVKPENHYLTALQLKKAQELAGGEINSSLVVRYRAICANQVKGFAYTDTHRVRTKPETLFLVVDLQGKIQKTEILSFDEPQDYIPRKEWYQRFVGERLSADLELKKKIPSVTGASLTSRATTLAARRTLAIDEVLRETSDSGTQVGPVH